MDARELPLRPNLEQYRKQAKERKKAGNLATLAEAQFALARSYGFESWAKFAGHIEQLSRAGTTVSAFEQAADAIVSGDLATLDRLLTEHPSLVRERSTRLHHATLLHYVSANGVEDFRQRTPKNAVAIARRLLDAGAEVDALADTYGGDSNQTTMNLLVSSVHPERAGVQSALVEVLLDAGSAINGLEDDGSPLAVAISFGYGEAAQTLARRGARVDTIVFAAALGREDAVRDMLKNGFRLLDVRWPKLPRDPAEHQRRALVWAAAFGHIGVIRLLLDHGVDVNAVDDQQFTPLHWAGARGDVAMAELLLERGADPSRRNQYGGTVLESTSWFAENSPHEGVDYGRMLTLLDR